MPTICRWVINGRLTSERNFKASTSPSSFINHSTLLLDRALKRQAPCLYCLYMNFEHSQRGSEGVDAYCRLNRTMNADFPPPGKICMHLNAVFLRRRKVRVHSSIQTTVWGSTSRRGNHMHDHSRFQRDIDDVTGVSLSLSLSPSHKSHSRRI